MLATDFISTQTYFEGKQGNNNWYLSTLDITLKTTDSVSTPSNITFWIDDGEKQHIQYLSPQNPILNPSFEKGFLADPGYWNENKPESASASLWRTQTEAHDGYYSALTYVSQPGIYYWDNAAYAYNVVAGELCSISLFIKTENLSGTGSSVEVWSKQDGGDQQIFESQVFEGTKDWTNLAFSFTVPPGTDNIYLKLVTEATGGATYWDGLSCVIGFHEASTGFTFGISGTHTLSYYAENAQGDKEDTKETIFKIDTLAPDFVRNFEIQPGGEANSFSAKIKVSDKQSGILAGSSRFRCSPAGSTEWSEWQAVASVSPANDGFTGEVTITSSSVVFPSAEGGSFQFKIADIAGNESLSLKMNASNAWIQSEGSGDIFVQGSINANSAPPAGSYNLSEAVFSGGYIRNFVSQKNRAVSYYSGNNEQLQREIKSFQDIKKDGIIIQNGILPAENGIFVFTSGLVLDGNTIPAGFDKATFSAVYLIEGDLTIKGNLALATETRVVWIVKGDVVVEGKTTETISGIFLVNGSFVSAVDNIEGKQLTIYGSIITIGDVLLNRDLGIDGNLGTPSEKIIYQPAYFFDEILLNYLLSGERLGWEEG